MKYPKNMLSYDFEIIRLLNRISSETPLKNLSENEREIVVTCAEKKYITPLKFSDRTDDGAPVMEMYSKTKVTYEGLCFKAKYYRALFFNVLPWFITTVIALYSIYN